MAVAPQHYLDSKDFIPLISRMKSVKPVHLLEISIGQSAVKIKAATITNSLLNGEISQGFDVMFQKINDCKTKVKCKLSDSERSIDADANGNYMAEAVKCLEKFFKEIAQCDKVKLFTVVLCNTAGYDINGQSCLRPLKKFLAERVHTEKPLTVYNFNLTYEKGSEHSREILSFLPYLRYTRDERLIIEQRPEDVPITLTMFGFAVLEDAHTPKKLTVGKGIWLTPADGVFSKFEHFDVYIKHEDMTFDFAERLVSELNRSPVFKSGEIKTSFDSANCTNNSIVRDTFTRRFETNALDLTEEERSANIVKWRCTEFTEPIILSIEGNWKFTFLKKKDEEEN